MLAGDTVALDFAASGESTTSAESEQGAISDVTVSPDGDLLLFTTIMGSVAVWDIATGDVSAVADTGGLPPASASDSLRWATAVPAVAQMDDATCLRVALPDA